MRMLGYLLRRGMLGGVEGGGVGVGGLLALRPCGGEMLGVR